MTRDGRKSGGKRFLHPIKDRLVIRLAEVFKDTDGPLPLEQVAVVVGDALPPGVAYRYYRHVIDSRRAAHNPITHRTRFGGTQSTEYAIVMGRRFRGSDCVRNQIVFGRLVREMSEDGVKMLRLTEHGRMAVEHWLRGEIAPRKTRDPIDQPGNPS